MTVFYNENNTTVVTVEMNGAINNNGNVFEVYNTEGLIKKAVPTEFKHDMNVPTVYAIVALDNLDNLKDLDVINSAIYVGSTCNFNYRICQHRYQCEKLKDLARHKHLYSVVEELNSLGKICVMLPLYSVREEQELEINDVEKFNIAYVNANKDDNSYDLLNRYNLHFSDSCVERLKSTVKTLVLS